MRERPQSRGCLTNRQVEPPSVPHIYDALGPIVLTVLETVSLLPHPAIFHFLHTHAHHTHAVRSRRCAMDDSDVPELTEVAMEVAETPAKEDKAQVNETSAMLVEHHPEDVARVDELLKMLKQSHPVDLEATMKAHQELCQLMNKDGKPSASVL